MKLFASTIVAVALGQYDYADSNDYGAEYYGDSGFIDFNDYGLDVSDVFDDDAELLEIVDELSASDDGADLIGGRSLGSDNGRLKKLPPGIKVSDYFVNGVFQKEAFRQALRAAIAAQNEAKTTTTSTTTTTTTTTTEEPTTTTTTTTEAPTALPSMEDLFFGQSEDDSRRPLQNLAVAAEAIMQEEGRGFIVGNTDYNSCRVCDGLSYAACRAATVVNCDQTGTAEINDLLVCQMRWEKEIGGDLKFYSGCALKSDCQAQEQQNFVGSVKMFHQCASTHFLENSRRRYQRGIKCSFCHKMGTTTTDLNIWGSENPAIAETTFTSQESAGDDMEDRLAAWAATQDIAPWYTTEVASGF